MKTSIALAALTALFASGAYAQDGADRSLASNLPVEQYHYGMNLDVQKIISKTDISGKTGTVPVTMVYQDSQGQLHKLRYLEVGGRNDDANG
ncbi:MULTISPECIES: DUF2790 domain-containing protein [unclassified Pseudomonas]|uniref:DUF2790 domain-containing protein n=1 Tax=unclassified Pseudomonas TaxID=196821 RepID=UPI000BD61D14|nr:MULTISPECIES: DUF2790 domain-containing protein [unclassified Pseudomonas]PVZ19988.1 uncharacterized protein DUF2790 [Pseudomonas sp. URIL14HWK12:I12]PVZ27054.1 uncharacterized protein DUF2790 [Pseudomonas sp. URIL14HWK12:I10]PVZ37943.1 uncharacterized protein DUF2790 [Pseudomonas sp. URIL14HWK12:I11]SNZ05046.1 Protein of unknown function [Pseudomonas sp. URIL14HWK12:I9]